MTEIELMGAYEKPYFLVLNEYGMTLESYDLAGHRGPGPRCSYHSIDYMVSSMQRLGIKVNQKVIDAMIEAGKAHLCFREESECS